MPVPPQAARILGQISTLAERPVIYRMVSPWKILSSFIAQSLPVLLIVVLNSEETCVNGAKERGCTYGRG